MEQISRKVQIQIKLCTLHRDRALRSTFWPRKFIFEVLFRYLVVVGAVWYHLNLVGHKKINCMQICIDIQPVHLWIFPIGPVFCPVSVLPVVVAEFLFTCLIQIFPIYFEVIFWKGFSGLFVSYTHKIKILSKHLFSNIFNAQFFKMVDLLPWN